MEDFNQLKKQMEALEDRVSVLEKRIIQGHVNAPEKKEEELSFREPGAFSQLWEWLKTDWLMKLGAFLLLLGMAWFVTYAFLNNWIGPIGRITLGILAGAGIMAGGHFAFAKRPNPGKVLMVLGGVTMLLTLFAARNVYDFFTPATAFAFMCLIVAAMAALAIIHQAQSVAIMAFLGGAFVPLLVDSPEPNYTVLLSYVFILNIATILIAIFKGWRSMILLALIGTGLYSMAFHEASFNDTLSESAVWIFMGLYFGLFLVSNIAAIWRTQSARVPDLISTGLNGLLFLYWTYEFIPREYASIVLSFLVLILAAIAYFLQRITQWRSLYLHVGLATLFLGAATAFELDGSVLTLAFAIESFIIVALAGYVFKEKNLMRGLAFAQLIPSFMALDSLNRFSYQTGSLFSAHFFAVLIALLSLYGTAWILHQSEKEDGFKGSVLPAVAGSFFLIMLIWNFTEKTFDSLNVAHGVSLVIYSLSGIALWLYGNHIQSKAYRLAGNILLLGVVLRLLLVEVWSMPLVARIITFVIIGILLISTAFLEKKNS